MLRDIHHGCRSLRKSLGFTTAALLTLTLGIGANTAIFSVVRGVVLAPLPFHDPDRLTFMLLYNLSLKHPTALSYPDFLDWRRNSQSFEQVAAFTGQGFDLSSPGLPEHLDGMEVSSNFFATLGVKPALGREFLSVEDKPGGPPAALISRRLWQERFRIRPSAIGKPITLNGVGYTVVGVLPPGFRFYQGADVYTALGRGNPIQRSDRTIHDIAVIGRLKPGLNLSQALAEMNIVQQHINDLNPAAERGQATYIVPLKQFLVGNVSGTLLLLLGAVGLVLLIACANIANLFLARSTARRREFAVRMALGASRGQIMRQLITEALLLSVTGGSLGLALAAWGVQPALAILGRRLPRLENVHIDVSVLAFTFGISVIVGVLFGLMPGLKSSRTDLQTGLKEAGRGLAGSHHAAESVLVVVQIALAMVLLAGGSLLVRTIRNLSAVSPGFDTQHLLTFQIGLSPSVSQTPSGIRNTYRAVLEKIHEIPGVDSAELTALVPLDQNDNSGPFWIGARQPPSMAEMPRALYYWVGPDYQKTMQMPLLSGRFLSRADTSDSEPVVVIDDLLARRYFRGADAVGQSMTIPHWGSVRVVGVVGHVRQQNLEGADPEDLEPQIYASFYQLLAAWVPGFSRAARIVVRTSGDPAAVMPAIKDAVLKTGSDQPIYNARTMQELVSNSLWPQWFPMLLLTAFAVLALLLACIGIYGVTSYATARRVPELGIRVALGADKRDILRLVIGHGLRLAAIGVLAGAAAGLILTRTLPSFSRLLYGVRASDPLTYVGLSLVLIGASLLACFIPARRAARVDPMITLREE